MTILNWQAKWRSLVEQLRRADRKTDKLFDYYVVTILSVLFVIIIEAMARQQARPEVITVLGSALGVDLGLIGLAAAHLWNAQKKPDSPADRAGAVTTTVQPPSGAGGGTVATSTTTKTTTTEPKPVEITPIHAEETKT